MKRLIIFLLSLALCSFSQAYAAKPCEELKAEIKAKIEANGVQSYEITIVNNEEAGNSTAVDGKIVGSCEGGTKKIIYTRNPKPVEPAVRSVNAAEDTEQEPLKSGVQEENPMDDSAV